MILKKSLPVKRYGAEKFKKFISIFSEIVKDIVLIFLGMIDLLNGVADRGFSISSVTSGPHRKWKMKAKFSKLIFQIKTYTPLLSLFSSVEYNWPHRKLKRQLPVISKRIFKFSIFCALNLVYYISVSLEFNICCWHYKCLE